MFYCFGFFQVISHTVAAGIWTLTDLDILPPEAKHTAEFISKIDQLFDVFNCSSLSHANPRRRGLQEKNQEETIQFLNETKVWLNTVKCKSGSDLPCIEGWKMNIEALKLLWKDQKEAGAESLFTRRLNQDLLEHFFGCIRGKGGHMVRDVIFIKN